MTYMKKVLEETKEELEDDGTLPFDKDYERSEVLEEIRDISRESSYGLRSEVECKETRVVGDALDVGEVLEDTSDDREKLLKDSEQMIEDRGKASEGELGMIEEAFGISEEVLGMSEEVLGRSEEVLGMNEECDELHGSLRMQFYLGLKDLIKNSKPMLNHVRVWIQKPVKKFYTVLVSSDGGCALVLEAIHHEDRVPGLRQS